MQIIRRLTLVAAVLVCGAMMMANAAWAGDGWGENYKQALEMARQQNKKVVIDFTGSDWCPWCIKLDEEIFSTAAFKEYAAKNLILLKIDFPQQKEQSAELKAQNEKLQKQFGIEGYPTVVVLDPNGKKIGELGYEEGGPKPFIAKLQKMR